MNLVLPNPARLSKLNALLTWAKLRILSPEVDWRSARVAIAGGCLRDTLLGKTVADVDIFHEGAVHDSTGMSKQELEDDQGQYRKPLAIWNCQGHLGVVQLIQVADLEERLGNFSCTLSEVYFRDGLLQMSPGFIESVRTNTLKFAGFCSDAYRKKILAKYPEFKEL